MRNRVSVLLYDLSNTELLKVRGAT